MKLQSLLVAAEGVSRCPRTIETDNGYPLAERFQECKAGLTRQCRPCLLSSASTPACATPKVVTAARKDTPRFVSTAVSPLGSAA